MAGLLFCLKNQSKQPLDDTLRTIKGVGVHRYRFLGQPIKVDGVGRFGDSNPSEVFDQSGCSWVLDQEETQHLVKTLRLKVGDPVEVTDGKGAWCLGVVGEIEKHRVVIFPHSGENFSEGEGDLEGSGERSAFFGIEPAPKISLHLVLGALKPGGVDEILPGLTELGVNNITVFLQEGSPNWVANHQAVERWDRILRQSIKQCKRSYLPRLSAVSCLKDALVSKQSLGDATVGYVLAEHSQSSLLKAALADITKNGRHDGNKEVNKEVILVCGSEKGLTDLENEFLRNQFMEPVSLGSGILRAKTAALVATGILAAVYHDKT